MTKLRKIAPFVLSVGLVVTLAAGCAAIGEFLDRPVDAQAAPGGGEVATVEGPGGTAVKITTPPPMPGPADDIKAPLPGGGEVEIEPPAPSGEPSETVGDVLAKTAAGAIGAVTGNPTLGYLALAFAELLLGKRREKKAALQAPQP